jgi:Zn-dependent protease with chaperone function
MRKLLVALIASAIISMPALAAPKTKALTAPTPPPYTGVYQPRGVDEIGLWREDDEMERALASSPLVIRDEALNAYVRNVLCKTVGSDRCDKVRLYILRVPMFNATMSPNGTMRVFSGLLLRTKSEAELGAVLGHEFGHFEKRHTLEQFKKARSGTDLLSWAAVLASMSGTRQSSESFDDIRLSVYGGLARFGRNQEREADLLGLGYLNDSQLSPQAASRVWRNLILEVEASSAARGLSKPNFNGVSFFASHPPEGERVNYLYALAAPDGGGRDEGADRHQAALKPWVTAFLDDQVSLNDFGATEFLINSVAESGWTADLWRARGDLFRTRGNPRDLMNAADFYTKSVGLNPELAEAHRGRGLSLIKTGRIVEGRAALERYLQLQPTASDASMIAVTVASLGEKQ